jgi:hypothetical protein
MLARPRSSMWTLRAHGSSTDCGTASWSTRRGKEALTARAMTSLVEGLNSEGTRNTKHSRCGGAHRVASPSTTFFRYRVFLGHRARIVRKGRVLSDAEYIFWRLQTRARRQLSAPSAPLTSSRAETASFRVDLACGGVEAKSTVRKSGDTGRSAPLGLAIHAVLAFPEEVKRHARRRAILLAFRLHDSSKPGVSYFVSYTAGRGRFGGKALCSKWIRHAHTCYLRA